MKKRIVSFISVILFLICCVIPVSAHAELVQIPLYYEYSDVLSDVSTNNYHYFFVKYRTNESIYAQDDYIRFYTTCFLLDDSSYNSMQVQSVDGVVKFSPVYLFTTYERYHTVHLVSGGADHEHQNCQSLTNSVERSSFKIDFNNNTISIWDSNGRLIRESVQLDDYDTDFEGFGNDHYDVEVSFSPDLSGNVDRCIIAQDGTKSMMSNLSMSVVNHSSFAIQYDMRIYKKNQTTHRTNAFDALPDEETDLDRLGYYSMSYDDDPVFIYYKNQWCYTTDYDSQASMLDSDTVKDNKSCSWHYLSSGSSDTVTFDYSQINLTEGEEYYCQVRCVRNDYGISSTQIVYLASSDPAYPDLKQIQGDNIQTVYNSDFVMINYSDVVYDPNNTNNGVNPYNGQNGITDKEKYTFSRNAREDNNGNVDYSSKDLLNDKNSWINKQFDNAIYNHYNPQAQSASSVSYYSPSVLGFFRSFLNYCPKRVSDLLFDAFIFLIVFGIIKRVI